MKRYGIIGGTFDPIHFAHLYIAYEAKNKLDLDKVIFMPAGIQPLKVENKVTSSALRLEMVKRAIASYDEFELSAYEIEKQGLSYTYETLEYLKQELKEDKEDAELFFITGADCLINIEKWKNIQRIFDAATLVVFARGGFDLDELKTQKEFIEKKYDGKIVILELKQLEISSTDIRNRIKENKRVDFFIPESVNKFINENNLYR